MHITYTGMADPTDMLAALGIAAPPELEALGAKAAEVRTLANRPPAVPAPHDDTAPENLRQAITDHVTAAAVQKWAQTNARNFEQALASDTRDLYASKATDYLPKIAKATVKPVKVLTDAAEHLRPGDTAETVLDRGDAAIRTWKAREELEDADVLLTFATHLTAYFAQRTPDSSRERQAALRDLPEVLWWVDTPDHATLDQIDGNLWEKSGVDRWLAVVQAGHPLRLATPDEAIARARAIERSRQAASPVFADRNHDKQMRTQRRWIDAYTA